MVAGDAGHGVGLHPGGSHPAPPPRAGAAGGWAAYLSSPATPPRHLGRAEQVGGWVGRQAGPLGWFVVGSGCRWRWRLAVGSGYRRRRGRRRRRRLFVTCASGTGILPSTCGDHAPWRFEPWTGGGGRTDSCSRVRVEIMGSQNCRILGKSQSGLIMIDPMIFTRTRIGAGGDQPPAGRGAPDAAHGAAARGQEAARRGARGPRCAAAAADTRELG
jgi:hypothetical protein